MGRSGEKSDQPESMPMNEGEKTTSIYRNNESKKRRNRQLKLWKILAILFIIISVALLAALIAVTVMGSNSSDGTAEGRVGSLIEEKKSHQPASCNPSASPATSSNRGNAVFSGLSPSETKEVVEYLMKEPELSLKYAVNATIADNYIYTVEDYLPNKKEVTDWLDGKTRNKPQRKAKVTLFMGKTKTVAEYYVWPIPSPRNKQLINRPADQMPTWKSRPVCNVVESPKVFEYVFGQLTKISPLISASFFPKGCNSFHECLYMNMAPRAQDGPNNERHIITWFFASPLLIEDYYMYPLPFYMILSIADDSTEFKIVKVYYNNMPFASLDELSDKYYRDLSIRYKIPDIEKNRGLYGSPKYVKQGDSLDQSRRPPQQYYPDGARFSVNGQHVEWLGWEFSIYSRTITGMQIFDVKYRDERIAYELSMQDVIVLYSGSAPDNFFKNYFDNGWSIGRYNLPLVRGVDCPAGAVYLNSSIYGVSQDKGVIMNDTICVFEYSNSIPLRRHYSSDFFAWGYRYAFSMPDSVLVARQILTIWNYDYIFDYVFHQNGLIEVKVSSTGYIAVTTNLNQRDPVHGYIVNPDFNAGANLHQHMFNFRFDLDIDGTANNFKTIEVDSQRVNTEYSSNSWYQMATTEKVINSESDAAIRYDFNKPKLYVIYNPDKKVYPGSVNPPPKGYRVQSNSFSKVVLPDESPLLAGGASWVKYQLAVTKFQEDERTTASHFVQGDPFHPDVSFERFISNDDNLIKQDLVVWATVGLHHIPTYEDLPVTTTPGKTLSVVLAPFFYNKRDPSIHSRDAAVFWGSGFNHTDEFLAKNATCLPLDKPPSIDSDN